jgi:hypothetical protein
MMESSFWAWALRAPERRAREVGLDGTALAQLLAEGAQGDTALHAIVREHLETFLAETRAQSEGFGVPLHPAQTPKEAA